MLLLAVNVNLQHARIPKRHRGAMAATLEALVDAVEREAAHVDLYFTGVSAEWLAQERPELVERVRALALAGRVGVGSHAYAHGVLPLLPERDRRWQLELGERAVERAFGSCGGFLPPEFALDARALALLARAGVEHVVAGRGRRTIEAFRVRADGRRLAVLRPGRRSSAALKRALSGDGAPPRLDPRRDHLLTTDAENPYFARRGRSAPDTWARCLRALAAEHRTATVAAWLRGATLPERDWRPRPPAVHRTRYAGIPELDARIERARRLVADDAPESAVRDLLLAESSDGYECLTQGIAGHGWDRDVVAALARLGA